MRLSLHPEGLAPRILNLPNGEHMPFVGFVGQSI
jgi:hypothetical protein